MHQLFCITGNKQYPITPIVGSIGWKSSTETLGVQLDFEVAFNDDRYFPLCPVDIGSMIILFNEAEIFRGIVVTENKPGRQPRTYTAFDPAFFINKSKAVYQFKKIRADAAIKKILNDFRVPIGTITPIPAIITKIYSGEVVSDIIKDILAQALAKTGVRYRMEMRAGKLYIERQQDLIIAPTFKIADNLSPVPVTAVISNPQRKRSIEDMKDSIVITCDDKIVATVKNTDMIKRYGLLQDVQSIDQKQKGQASTIASNLLKELGRVLEENGIDCPGSDDARSGRLIQIEEPITGMSGKYLIKEDSHVVKDGIHTMHLDLGVA